MSLFSKTDAKKDALIELQQKEIEELKQKVESLNRQLEREWENRHKQLGMLKDQKFPKFEIVEDGDYIRVVSMEEGRSLSTHRKFDKTKGNHGWVDQGKPMVEIAIENVPYMTFPSYIIKAPACGIYEADTNKQIEYKEEICRIRVYRQEDKDAVFESIEREEAKMAILKKERKKRYEMESLEELINEGLVFNSYTKRDGSRSTIPMDIASAVWNRDGGKCVMCGAKEDLEFDHIIPISKGGASTFRNLQLLCRNCNIIKSDNI